MIDDWLRDKVRGLEEGDRAVLVDAGMSGDYIDAMKVVIENKLLGSCPSCSYTYKSVYLLVDACLKDGLL